MKAFVITDRKLLMQKLLKEDVFDAFLVHQITIKKGASLVIDGETKANASSGSQDFEESEEAGAFTPTVYKEVRPVVYAFIKGSRTPSMMKFVLLTPKVPEGIDSRSINILFRDGVMAVTTGLARRDFSLDKSFEEAWDRRIERLLTDLGIDFEV